MGFVLGRREPHCFFTLAALRVRRSLLFSRKRKRFNLEVQQHYGDTFFVGLILPQVLILTS